MTRIILSQEITFRSYTGKGWHCEIPLAEGNLLINISEDCVYYGRKIAPEID